jgi:hypothetical protein
MAGMLVGLTLRDVGDRDPIRATLLTLGLGVPALCIAVLIIVGALKLRRFESYPWVVTSVFLGAVTSFVVLIGLPLGIVGFFVLRRPAVRAAFARRAAAPEPVQVPTTLWCTLTALLVCLSGAIVGFMPNVSWANVETHEEGLRTMYGRPPLTYKLLGFRSSDFVAPALVGIVFLGLFLFLVATARIRPYTLIRPAVILLGAAAILFGLSMDFVVELPRVEKGAWTPTPIVERPGTTPKVREWTEYGTIRVRRASGPEIPVQANYDGTYATYFVGTSHFTLAASVPDLGLFDMLLQRTTVQPQVPPYLAMGLAMTLLMLAALQMFFILGRNEPERVAIGEPNVVHPPAERCTIDFATSPPPQPASAPRGHVRSFFGAIYSIVFETRR